MNAPDQIVLDDYKSPKVASNACSFSRVFTFGTIDVRLHKQTSNAADWNRRKGDARVNTCDFFKGLHLSY